MVYDKVSLIETIGIDRKQSMLQHNKNRAPHQKRGLIFWGEGKPKKKKETEIREKRFEFKSKIKRTNSFTVGTLFCF